MKRSDKVMKTIGRKTIKKTHEHDSFCYAELAIAKYRIDCTWHSKTYPCKPIEKDDLFFINYHGQDDPWCVDCVMEAFVERGESLVFTPLMPEYKRQKRLQRLKQIKATQ